MALSQEEKTQKQIDAAVKAAVKRERATVKSVLANTIEDAKQGQNAKLTVGALKNFATELKNAQAIGPAP